MTDDVVHSLDFGEARSSRPYARYVRELSEGDLAALNSNARVQPKSLLKIRTSHHSVARCMAAGMKNSQAALVTGYTAERIAALMRDPTFQSLVADYRNEVKSIFADLAERMNDLSLDAIEILHERLHEEPQEFSIPMLLDVVKAFADRTGHGPGQEVKLSLATDTIDRPPRESYEDWESRRNKELEVKKIEPDIKAAS